MGPRLPAVWPGGSTGCVNQALQSMKDDGKLADLQDEWLYRVKGVRSDTGRTLNPRRRITMPRLRRSGL